jgi:hypothetical protein
MVLEAGCEKAQCSVIDMGYEEEGAEGFCQTITYMIAKIKSRQFSLYKTQTDAKLLELSV